MFVWVALEENARSATKLWIIKEVCSNRGFLLEQWKIYQKQKTLGNPMLKRYLHGPVTWKVHAKKCVERCCELANKATEQFYEVATPCMDDHQFREEEIGSVGEMSIVCSHIVLTCLYLACIGRPDVLWSVNKLARAITKWTSACDKRLARLISYTHHRRVFKQFCHVGNTAQ